MLTVLMVVAPFVGVLFTAGALEIRRTSRHASQAATRAPHPDGKPGSEVDAA